MIIWWKDHRKIFWYILEKLVDCLEKCLIYGHIRRFADWFYYSFTTFNELSLDMQKHLRSCRINHYTTLRGTSKRKNKISTTYKAAFLTPTQENRNAAFFMPSCYAVRANKALIYAALRARKWERQRDALGTQNISTLKWAIFSTRRTEAAWKKSNRLTLPPLW